MADDRTEGDSGSAVTVSTKGRVLSRLVSARVNNEWLTRKTLLEIGVSKPNLTKILIEAQAEGLIERTGARGGYRYRATDRLQTLLEKGPLPRGTQRKGERNRAIDVNLRPIGDYLDVSGAWMEHIKASVHVDRYTADLIRARCEPPGARDRAQQFSHSCKDFAVSVSRRGTCMLTLKTLDWLKSLGDFLTGCGLTPQASMVTLNQVGAQLPDAFRRIEVPVIQRDIKQRRVEFKIRTQSGDDWVESNINYSTDVDLETLGTGILVDNWLAVLAATQHNTVAVFEALQKSIAEFTRKAEELRKEQEKQKQREGEKNDTTSGYI